MFKRLSLWGGLFCGGVFLYGGLAPAASTPAAPTKPTTAQTAPPIEVCLPSFRSEFMNFVVLNAADKGYFKENGLNITVRTIRPDGRHPSQQWEVHKGRISRNRSLDFHIASKVKAAAAKDDHQGQTNQTECTFGSSVMEHFIAHPDAKDGIVPLMVSDYGAQYDTHLVVAKDSKIRSIKDLKGKSIHIGQLPTYLAVMGVLQNNGMTGADVKLSYAKQTGVEKLGDLTSGRIAAMTAYLPTMAYLLATDKVRVLEANIVSRYVGKRLPHSMLIVNSKFAAANPKVVAAFHSAVVKSYEDITRNPLAFFKVYIKHKWLPNGETFSPVVMEKANAFLGPVVVTDIYAGDKLQQLDCDVRQYAHILVSRGYLDKGVDLSDWLGAGSAKGACPMDLAGG